MEIIKELIVSAAIPSAVTSLLFWMLKRQLDRSEKHKEDKEAKREELELIILDTVNSAVTLSEATARAVQRIPDAKCNGDMHAALDKTQEAKQRQREFLTKEGLHNII